METLKEVLRTLEQDLQTASDFRLTATIKLNPQPIGTYDPVIEVLRPEAELIQQVKNFNG